MENRDPLRETVDRFGPPDLVLGELGRTLQTVVTAAATSLAVTGAGLLFVDEGFELRNTGSSDRWAHEFEDLEAELGVGPCVDGLLNDTIVDSSDLHADERWPRLRAGMGSLPVRAVLAMPIRLGGGAVGSFNVYRDEPSEWTEADLRATGRFVEIVETLVASTVAARKQEELVAQLQHALDNRVTIERAIGVVMAQERLDPVAAFNQIRFQARADRRKVVDVAADVLASSFG